MSIKDFIRETKTKVKKANSFELNGFIVEVSIHVPEVVERQMRERAIEEGKKYFNTLNVDAMEVNNERWKEFIKANKTAAQNTFVDHFPSNFGKQLQAEKTAEVYTMLSVLSRFWINGENLALAEDWEQVYELMDANSKYITKKMEPIFDRYGLSKEEKTENPTLEETELPDSVLSSTASPGMKLEVTNGN